MENKIYEVTTEGDVEGKTTKYLGYCTGDIDDIKNFYNDKKTYEIHCKEIRPKHITKEMVDNKKELIKRKHEIECELKIINEKIS